MPCTEFQKGAVLRNTPFRPQTDATLLLPDLAFVSRAARVHRGSIPTKSATPKGSAQVPKGVAWRGGRAGGQP
jgi:hypothetical protein